MARINKFEVIKEELINILRYGHDVQTIIHNLRNLVNRYDEGDLIHGKIEETNQG